METNLDTLPRPSSVEVWYDVDRATFENEIQPLGKPAILKGLVNSWPIVAASQDSPRSAAAYLSAGQGDKIVDILAAPKSENGRYFYNDTLNGFNFKRGQVPFRSLLEKLLQVADTGEPLNLYAAAFAAPEYLPTFQSDNPLPLVDPSVTPLLWVGSSARIAPHFDASENIACCVRGSRRFLIFPPDQVSNLYIGPIENTMAGQPASMVDPNAPDLQRFPNYPAACEHSLEAILEPGDALYIPSLWWHYVESEGPLNVLVNYWWDGPPGMTGICALAHAMLAYRELPQNQKQAWRTFFEHYVFSENATEAVDHLPPAAKGVLGPKTPYRDQYIRQFLAQQLNQKT